MSIFKKLEAKRQNHTTIREVSAVEAQSVSGGNPGDRSGSCHYNSGGTLVCSGAVIKAK